MQLASSMNTEKAPKHQPCVLHRGGSVLGRENSRDSMRGFDVQAERAFGQAFWRRVHVAAGRAIRSSHAVGRGRWRSGITQAYAPRTPATCRRQALLDSVTPMPGATALAVALAVTPEVADRLSIGSACFCKRRVSSRLSARGSASMASASDSRLSSRVAFRTPDYEVPPPDVPSIIIGFRCAADP